MIKYKIDVMNELSKAGFNSQRLRNEKILSQSTMQKLRHGENSITLQTLNIVCVILKKQPSDIIEIAPTNDEKIKYF